MSASEHLSGAQFAPVARKVIKDFGEHGQFERMEEVPRHTETGAAPTRAYRWAHHEAVKGYLSEGVPRGTYFSIDKPDDRYRASDHQLVSVPYSDAHFRSSVNMQGEHYVSTTTTVPSHLVTRH